MDLDRTPLETVLLRDRVTDARVALAPARGGIATRFFVGDRQVFYLDETTLLAPEKNVRGGAPVLFPSPGPLAGGSFHWRGHSGKMPQHGFARTLPWTVVAQDEGAVTLELRSNETTRAQFPWPFVLTFRYSLTGRTLRIDQRFANEGATAMPFAMGFHPYFYVPQADKANTRIPTSATRAYDNVQKREVSLDGPIDLTRGEVDLHLVDHGSAEATLALADGSTIVVSGASEYTRWVVWTLAGKDFVCLEPWTAAADALNTERGLTIVPAGEAHVSWTTISLS